MPCKQCGKKWKWGENGECKYDSKDACEKANPKHYESLKNTKIVELVISDDSEELTIDAISLVTSPAIEQDFVFFGKEKNNLTLTTGVTNVAINVVLKQGLLCSQMKATQHDI